MAKVYGYLDENTFPDIASAINEKRGTSETYAPSGMSAAIRAIPTGVDVSDATASAGDIVAGKTAYIATGKVEGTLAVVSYYTGEEEPEASLGNVGDVYFMMGTSPAVTYSISHSLIGCTLDNNAVEVAENGSYEATITIADNYYLREIIVSMGGVNITDTAYTSGTKKISIPDVTGDIVIAINCQYQAPVIDDEIGSVSSTDNEITLNSSVGSGTFTLYYEDNSNNKLTDYGAIGTITQ